MKLQDELATALADGLGTGYVVNDYPTGTDAPTGRTVHVWCSTIDYLPAAQADYRLDFTVEILTRHEDPKAAEADLAAALMDVLAVVQGTGSFLLTKADRTVTDSRIHSWTLTVTGGANLTPEE